MTNEVMNTFRSKRYENGAYIKGVIKCTHTHLNELMKLINEKGSLGVNTLRELSCGV